MQPIPFYDNWLDQQREEYYGKTNKFDLMNRIRESSDEAIEKGRYNQRSKLCVYAGRKE